MALCKAGFKSGLVAGVADTVSEDGEEEFLSLLSLATQPTSSREQMKPIGTRELRNMISSKMNEQTQALNRDSTTHYNLIYIIPYSLVNFLPLYF
jgi:hypothetical protein